jgi:ABC-type transport system substrate-binding protein
MKTWWMFLVAFACVSAGCGGAGAPDAGSSAPSPAKSAAAGGGTLTVATADTIESLDPALAYDTWSTAVVHAVTRRLVDYDDAGELVADLAESWDLTDDGKTYRFAVKPAEIFADGSPIEAKHFVAAIKRVQDPKIASKGAAFYSGIASVEAPDATTLVVKLKKADPTLLNVLGMTFAAPYKPDATGAPLASGPYRVIAYDPRAQVTLQQNPSDHNRVPGAEKLVVQLGVGETLQVTRLRAGEVDLLPAVPAAEYPDVIANSSEKARIVQGEVNQTWYFGMNTAKAPWNSPKVRRAALLAIDRGRQVELAGAGTVANGILPPHIPGYKEDRKPPERNVEAAKNLVAQAEYESRTSELPTTVLWLAANDQNQRHAEAIQADLREVGISVELRPVTLSQFLSGYRREADCWYNGWYPDFPDAGNFMEPVFHSRNIGSGKNNAARYRNPKFDALLDKAQATPLGDARRGLFAQCEDLLLEDLPWIPLYYEVETRWFGPGVRGVRVHPVWRQILTGISKG